MKFNLGLFVPKASEKFKYRRFPEIYYSGFSNDFVVIQLISKNIIAVQMSLNTKIIL